jgi:hypothetical protein
VPETREHAANHAPRDLAAITSIKQRERRRNPNYAADTERARHDTVDASPAAHIQHARRLQVPIALELSQPRAGRA